MLLSADAPLSCWLQTQKTCGLIESLVKRWMVTWLYVQTDIKQVRSACQAPKPEEPDEANIQHLSHHTMTFYSSVFNIFPVMWTYNFVVPEHKLVPLNLYLLLFILKLCRLRMGLCVSEKRTEAQTIKWNKKNILLQKKTSEVSASYNDAISRYSIQFILVFV